MRQTSILALLLAACGEPGPLPDRDGPLDPSDILPGGEAADGSTCPPQMVVFPVLGEHNIGYDHRSCGSGTCEISCPDENANSDWGGDHHGIDVFAWHRAPLIAVADGQVVRVGTPSSTSGLRVRLRDACGWEYYYGHLDEAAVFEGEWVEAGDLLGYMGATGTASTHLHFNVSWDGDYSDDIDPFDLLWSTSDTVCDGTVDDDSGSGGGSSGGGSSDGGSSDGGSSGGGSSSDGGSSDGGSSGGGGSSDGGSSTDGGLSDWGCGAVGGTTIFEPGDMLSSCDGRFTLVQQTDGNLVLYELHGSALWHTGTHGYSGAWSAMQDDGNLVVYSSSGTALWSTGTHGHAGAFLAVQDDGNMVVYSSGGTALWNSGTCCR